MTPEDYKIQIEYCEFMLKHPYASRGDFENHRAHRLSGGKLKDPTKTEQFAIKKARWEHRNGKG